MAPREGKWNPHRIRPVDTISGSVYHVPGEGDHNAQSTNPPMETGAGNGPTEATGGDIGDVRLLGGLNPTTERRIKSPKPTARKFTLSESGLAASSSRAHWAQLRGHVLTAPSKPTTPSQDLPMGITSPLAAPRPQTPKLSRLARLGFRQALEHAREVIYNDSRQFAQELEKICWSIRSSEKGKYDHEIGTTGPPLQLPFISNPSVSKTTGVSTVESIPHGIYKASEIRTPQSIRLTPMDYREIPSVKPLHQAILYRASTNETVPLTYLPCESLVLSTLLGPFLNFGNGPNLEQERWLGIEAFEVITRTWTPRDQAMTVERYLWCCKAASIGPSTMRTQLLGILSSLMESDDTNYSVTSPECFQSIVQGLFSLLPSLGSLSMADQDVILLKDIIAKVRSGCCGELDLGLARESYNVTISAQEDGDLLRGAVLLEALSRCLEGCTDDTRLWLFLRELEQYWIDYPRDMTPLCTTIYSRTLNNISRAILSLLSIPLNQIAYLQRAKYVAVLIERRFIPAIDRFEKGLTKEMRLNVVNIVMELISTDQAKESAKWGISLVSTWYQESPRWKEYLENALEELVSNGNWPRILFRLSSITKLLPDETRKPLVAFFLPLLHGKIVEAPPAYPCPMLTNLLDEIARLYPQVFYKPLFSCAASHREFSVVNYLCVIVVTSKFLPDFWVRDPEMMSVALMSDAGTKKATSPQGELRSWPKARLGQSVLILELIGCIQAVRREKEAIHNLETSSRVSGTVKFVMILEPRLGILLEAKEQYSLIPPSHRLLFCILLREMRLLTRSLQRASWLSRSVTWFTDFMDINEFNQDPEVEEKSAVGQIQGLYAAALDGVRSAHQRRSTVLLSKTLEKAYQPDAPAEDATDLVTLLTLKETLIASLSKGFVAKALKLFVTMSTLLDVSDYRRLVPHLWGLIQSDDDSSMMSSLNFLVMKGAEKIPKDLLPIVEIELQSSDNNTKLDALHKISILFNWRFQTLSQPVIADRSRRPFKVTRGPLPFTATDVGSSSYILEGDPSKLKDSLPLELRKRLAEVGWDQNDEPVNQQHEWTRTPMSLLPIHQLSDMGGLAPDMSSLSPPLVNFDSTAVISADKMDEIGLLRRNSSSGGPQQGMKRKAVFVPSLTHIFPRLASLVFDPSFSVSYTAKQVLLDFMRNDPSLLTRPVLDLFSGEEKNMQSATSTINALLDVQGVLPPPMAHHMFNSLAGFLKHTARNTEEDDPLDDFASVIPILSQLVTQVSGISIREIRRAKLETFLIPSGSLWFHPSAPVGPMFPRRLGLSANPFQSVPSDLVSMTMIRVSQNLLFLAMLKRDRQDVQVIRKNMSRLDLPSLNSPNDSPLELSDFIPRKSYKDDGSPSLTSLSLMLSRTHVLLVAQIFRSISRHLNDRAELAILMDGLNRILLVHGDDIGIVGHVLIALMVASTRFRRLFISGLGYTLFMPAIVKVYTESESHPGIRLAIEYAVNRFFALHHEAFVFQTLDIIGYTVALPGVDRDWLSRGVYDLFYALRKGHTPSAPDAAGIHNMNKNEERDALIATAAEDTPTLLSLLRRGDPAGAKGTRIELPEEYESNRLGPDNLVRLFLTVIAHDPSTVRAQHFLQLLQFMTPHLYHASSSARSLLQEGVDAIGVILLKAPSKPKGNDTPSQPPTDSGSEPFFSNIFPQRSQSASNVVSMRRDYASLIVAFTMAGGQLSRSTIPQVLDLIKLTLKDYPSERNSFISSFLTDFCSTFLLHESQQNVKMVVSFLQYLSPFISDHFLQVDFSGLFQVVAKLAANSTYANDSAFSHVVVEVCGSGLVACEAAASAKLLLSLPSRLNLVKLLAQSVLLRGGDVITEVERRPPSYGLLAGVVLPLTMSLQTEHDLESGDIRSQAWNRDALKYAWIRLLSYAMSACDSHSSLEKTRSQDKKSVDDMKRPQPPVLIMALQVLKAIVIRAEAELSAWFPGIWSRLASFLVNTLAEGNGNFASLSQENSSRSPLPLPSRTSAQFSEVEMSTSEEIPNLSSSLPLSNPRIIDYALWSVLELLCIRPNPLLLQMRLFMLERLVELDRNLYHQYNRDSVDSRNRRISTPVFSKPRRRSRLPFSNSSPHPSPSPSFQHDNSFSSLEIGRQPGYVISSSHETIGPKIVHLGPISNASAMSAFGRPLALGSSKGVDIMGRNTEVRSLTLVRGTYRRIRTVQTYMGYEKLVPMPNGKEAEADEVFIGTWTKKQALDAIMKETQELLEEYDGSDRSSEEVLVEPDQSFSFHQGHVYS